MRLSHLRQTAAVAALIAAQPALADVTAEDVWGNLQSMITDMGATIDADSSANADGTLKVDQISYTVTFPEGSMTGNIDALTFAEQGDGTVKVTLDGAYTLALDIMPETGDPVAMGMSFDMPGLEMIASGAPDAVNWAYSADAMIGTLDSMDVNGEAIPAVLNVNIGPSTGAYTSTEGDAPTFESSLNSDALSFDGSFTDPDNDANTITFSASYSDFSTSSAGNAASMMAMSDPEAFLSGGANMSGSYSHGGGSLKMDVISVHDGDMSIAYETASGAIDFAIGGDGVDYSVKNTGLSVTASGAMVPLPEIAAQMEKFEVGVNFPLAKSETASDMGVLIHLGGLTVSDMLWSMVDPSGGLPHDPATFLLSIAGKMRLTADLTDEAAMNAPLPPVAFEDLDLTGLTVSIAGAELTGEGGFDFAGAPAGAFPGMPGVGGKLNLRLEGANALLEKLVNLGLVPQDMAMTAQMMSGMVARTTGDDVLESEIELGTDGSISANGNRLK